MATDREILERLIEDKEKEVRKSEAVAEQYVLHGRASLVTHQQGQTDSLQEQLDFLIDLLEDYPDEPDATPSAESLAEEPDVNEESDD